MTRHTDHDAHAELASTDWRRMRAGFAIQGPYPRRQRVRVMRWLLALAALAAVIAWRL